jgi:hypothetical protein
MGIETAIIGSALLGTVASSRASSKAAGAQRDAAKEASDTQLQMFNRTTELQEPWRQAGMTALGQLGTGTAPGGDFMRTFGMSDFQADPGYDFRMQQGLQGIERSAAARGGSLSGGVLKQLTRYGQGLASDEYGAAYNRFNNDQTQRFNRLASLAGIGQNATNQVQSAGMNTAGNIGNLQTQAGNARASGYIGQANALNSGLSTIGNAFINRPMQQPQPALGQGGLSGYYYNPGSGTLQEGP